MPYRVQIVSAETWRPLMEVKPLSGSWSRARNAGRGGQMTVQVRGDEYAQDVRRLDTWPFQRWVVVEWASPGSEDYRVLYAGAILNPRYSWLTGQLSISHTDIWAMWTRRLVLASRTASAATEHLKWTGMSLGMLAKRAVAAGLDPRESHLNYALPVVLPADVPGTVDRTVYGYNFETVQDLLDEVLESEAGPNIDFRPRWSSEGTLEWVMEFNANGSVVFDYDLDAEDSPVKDLEYALDGSHLANFLYGVGEGSEKKTLVRISDAQETPYIALEDVESFKEVSKLDRLQRLTTGSRLARDGAIRTMTMKVTADGPPKVTDLRVGASVRWKAEVDKYFLSGWSVGWELLEYGGSFGSEEINLVFQDFEGAESGA